MKTFARYFYPVTAVVLFLAFGSALHAQKMTVRLDPAQTEIRWKLTDTLHNIHGTFKLKTGKMSFDPAVGLAEGEFLVDADSGDSGSSMRDGVMKKKVLQTDRYPLISFRAAKIAGEPKPASMQDVTVDGTFNIHGADHALRMGLKVQMDGDKIAATTHFVVPYVDWGMKDPSNFVLKAGKQVDVDVVTHGTIEAAH
ncbi:MAG TPA: YceI family protein [Acidisarcina sp.]|nr:YceI family protein [Acidisarcina sp.]